MDPSEKKAAMAIMRVFKEKAPHVTGFVNFNDFGKALRWEAGYVKHDNQRAALEYLVSGGFVVEMNSGLELTEKGHAVIEKL